MPRLFIAIGLPDPVRRELAAVQQRLARRAPALRWVGAEQLHLTLLFLGETPEEDLPGIGRVMTASAAAAPRLDLALGEIGTFGPPDAPRIVWAAVQAPPALASLQHRLAEGCATLGLTIDDRPFTPHLTLARAPRDGAARIPPDFANGLAPQPLPFTAREIVLFESQPGPSAPVYQPRHASRLAGR
jgi:2'-5' RNA ligase